MAQAAAQREAMSVRGWRGISLLLIACRIAEPPPGDGQAVSRSALETVAWTPASSGPPEREAAGLAYDPQRARLVLFGGDVPDGLGACFGMSTDLGDTWEQSDGGWIAFTLDAGPSARSGHALSYAGGGKTLLFGGSTGSGETWLWDGAAWTAGPAGPTARCSTSMAYDEGRRRLVLFGGSTNCVGAPPALGDTWEWDGAAWALVADAGPSPRFGHVLTFDSRRNRTVLVGGFDPNVGVVADTWEWNGVSWQLMAASDAGPPNGYGMSAAYDPFVGRTLLATFERDCNKQTCSCSCTYTSLTWAWDGAAWTRLLDGGFPGRAASAMAFDTGRRRAVLFGGSTDDCCCGYPVGDSWELASVGGTCAVDSDCDTGHCVDAVCCSVASCGTCQACQSGTAACAKVVSQPDPDSCHGTCDVNGACVAVSPDGGAADGGVPDGGRSPDAGAADAGSSQDGGMAQPRLNVSCGCNSEPVGALTLIALCRWFSAMRSGRLRNAGNERVFRAVQLKRD